MKKKLILSVVAIILVAAVAVGGSLAYFTDNETATNTFTVGNVDISVKEDFDGDKLLMPGSSSTTAVKKLVTVENTGSNDAWVWVEIKIPTALLDEGYANKTSTNESNNSLHYNTYGYFSSPYYPNYSSTPISDGILDKNGDPTDQNMVAVSDGLWTDFSVLGQEGKYTVLRSAMEKKLPAGKVSLPALRQVYMDYRVTEGSTANSYKLVSNVEYNGSWEVIVTAYAVQGDGIENCEAAIAAYNAE